MAGTTGGGKVTVARWKAAAVAAEDEEEAGDAEDGGLYDLAPITPPGCSAADADGRGRSGDTRWSLTISEVLACVCCCPIISISSRCAHLHEMGESSGGACG